MTIVASNSLTVSNVNDGTITHTAYAYSVDGTDRFTTIYPNLNLIEDGKFAKPISSKWNTDGTTISKDDITGYFKVKFNGAGSLNRTYYTAGISTIPIGQKYSVYIKAYSLESSLNIKMGSVNTSQAVTVTNNSNIPKTYKVEGLVRGVSDTFGIFGGLTTTLGTLFISEIKLEQGSTATPYMSSASEVKTSDYPNYIGTYSDGMQTNSTNPSAYTWSLIRGNDGKDGATGPQGPQGNTGPQGPAGSNGDPGKIISDAEPTTKFKGLTWKYSGITAINASDGTNIQPNTEYYWNGNNWVINLINAHNINVDDLSAISTTLTNGKFISNWSSDNATGTTTIEKNHFIINSANASLNTENTIALDNEQGMMMTYNNKTNKRTISVGVNFQGLFVTDSTGPYVSVTPTGIVNSVDVSWTTIGSYAAYRRDGRVVTIRVVGAKTSTTGNINIGSIPLKDCPAASVMGDAIAWSASVTNDKHIQINGLNQQNSGTVTILSAAANQEYTFQFTYQI